MVMEGCIFVGAGLGCVHKWGVMWRKGSVVLVCLCIIIIIFIIMIMIESSLCLK